LSQAKTVLEFSTPTEAEKEASKAVATLVEFAATSNAPNITEKSLVRAVVNFANTGQARDLPGAPVIIVNGQSFCLASPEMDALRAQLQNDLTAVVQDALAGSTLQRLRKDSSRMVQVPIHEMSLGVPTYRYFPMDLSAVLAHTVLMLRDKAKNGLGKDLKQCKLAGCGQFFLSSDMVADTSKGGRPRERFCKPEHMAAAQTPGAERTRQWRASKARQLASLTAAPTKKE